MEFEPRLLSYLPDRTQHFVHFLQWHRPHRRKRRKRWLRRHHWWKSWRSTTMCWCESKELERTWRKLSPARKIFGPKHPTAHLLTVHLETKAVPVANEEKKKHSEDKNRLLIYLKQPMKFVFCNLIATLHQETGRESQEKMAWGKEMFLKVGMTWAFLSSVLT